MSKNTHKLMGFYMEVFNTRCYTLVHGFCSFKLVPIGCVGLTTVLFVSHLCIKQESLQIIWYSNVESQHNNTEDHNQYT